MPIQYRPTGRSATEIAANVESAVRDGRLVAGAALPPVRSLAAALHLSPATVAAAYRELRAKGIARGNGRAGTRITAAPPIGPRAPVVVPAGVRDLIAGSPDPALLPPLPRVSPPPRLYGAAPVVPALAAAAARHLAADGIDPAALAVISGALDGVERLLQAWLRPGDRVAVEDPGYPPVLDLLGAMNLAAVPVPVDDFGARAAALDAALSAGCLAVLLTPRAQAPTGAAWDASRAAELSEVISQHQHVLVVEDDHAGPVSGAVAHHIAGCAQRWATVRSVSKSLGPDLRLAVLAGDEATVARVEGRQALGPGWVSYLLQETVARLWADPAAEMLMQRAAAAYAQRRGSLLAALAARHITAHGRSGLAVWIPVADEAGVVSAMLDRGWAVAPGERFRIASPPAIRIGTGTLSADDAQRLAADLAGCLRRASPRSD